MFIVLSHFKFDMSHIKYFQRWMYKKWNVYCFVSYDPENGTGKCGRSFPRCENDANTTTRIYFKSGKQSSVGWKCPFIIL